MHRAFSRLSYFIPATLSNRFGKYTIPMLCLSALAGCGSGLAGGITLDAPVADLEGGTTRESFLCGDVPGAPSSSSVRITNISDVSLGTVEVPLNEEGQTYSAKVCLRVGQSANIQAFDASGEAISEISTVTRISGEDNADCPDPFVTQDNCP